MEDKKSVVLYSLIVPAITFFLAILVSYVQNKVSFGIIILCFITSSLFYFSVLFVLSKFISNEIINNHNDVKDEIFKQLNMKLGEGDKLLMNTQDGVDFEKKRLICSSCQKKRCPNRACNKNKCKNYCEEIWLLTQDLEEDQEGGPYAQIVSDNLKKGIKYRYIVPKDDAPIKARATEIEVNNNSQQLNFYYLDKNFFFLSSKLDLSIYNPMRTRGSERRAFMGIPLEGKNERYQIPVSNDLISAIVGMIQSQIETQNN